MTAPQPADEALVQYRGLVAAHGQAVAEVDRLRAEIDAELARLVAERGHGGAVAVARLVGVHRNEIDRRLRRHRAGS